MEQIREFGEIYSSVAWCAFFIIICYQFVKGMFNYKELLKLFGIAAAIGFGHEIVLMVFSTSKPSYDPLKCTSLYSYMDCAGWPIFSTSLTYLAEKVLKFGSWLFAFNAAVVQFIAGIYLLSKFTRSIWTVDFKQILLAFLGASILFLSLLYTPYLNKIFMNMTQYLLGFGSHYGGSDNSIDEVVNNIKDWNNYINVLMDNLNDESILPFNKIQTTLKLGFVNILYFLVNIPLFWFSILNIIMMFMQQLMLLSLPIDAIKMSLTFQLDPLIIVKKLLSISLLSMAVVTEYHLLNYLPSPPTLIAGGLVGSFISLGWSMVIILVVLFFATIFSTILVFKSFFEAKQSINGVA